MQIGKSGANLADVIKKAIRDCEISSSEYDEIFAVANEDGIIDSQEQQLLKQLQQLIANGTIKRVAG